MCKKQTKEMILYEAIGEIDPKYIKEVMEMKQANKQRARLLPVMIAAILAVVTLAATATVMVYRGKLNADIVMENKQLDTVPEGYVGIYEAKELDKLREDLDGRYILMSDISLAGVEWAPVGTVDAPFTGVFNGNGHVISDLAVAYDAAAEDTVFAGLFGNAQGAAVYNVGLRDADIRVSNVDAGSSFIGTIAGNVGYLASSYTENCRLSVVFASPSLKEGGTSPNAYVGGLCGKVTTVDSCISQTELVLDGVLAIHELASYERRGSVRILHGGLLYAGKVCGLCYSSVTSYAEGHIEDRTGKFVTGLVGYTRLSPSVLPASLYDEIVQGLRDFYSANASSEKEAEFKVDKWRNNYFHLPDVTVLGMVRGYQDISDRPVGEFGGYPVAAVSQFAEDAAAEVGFETLLQFLFYRDISPDETYYMADVALSIEECICMDYIILEACGTEKFRALLDQYYVRVGTLYCYDLAETPDTDFNGFDFNRVWKIENGKPKLAIFADSAEGDDGAVGGR